MFSDKGIGKDGVGIGAQLSLHDSGKVKPHWTIHKFDTLDDKDGSKYGNLTLQELLALGLKPYEVLEFEGNQMMNDGYNNIVWPAVVGATPTYINGTDGCMGVGDSTVAAAATQTALQAASNHLWVILSATPTTGTSQQLVASASFSTSQANWVWNEIMVGTTTTPASLPNNATTPPSTAHVLNRLVVAMGTKVSTATWVATLTITLS